MKTLKVMGITGLVIAGLSWICMASFTYSDPSAALGWGYINILYSISLSIVAIVQSKKGKVCSDTKTTTTAI
jgi:hypothetical protein